MLKPVSQTLLTLCCLPLALGHAQTWTADNGNGTYTNPLFYEEFADPDVIRVGADFYLTGSSMHAMPGLPVLHSKDLVNWEFLSYAVDKLDLGPAYRLEDGKNVYGDGTWAPCLRYHNGTFYLFANVNGQTTQMFRATNPRGPWTRTPMKMGFHDLSVLFDDDGKTYVVWGYQNIEIAQLDAEMTGIVPGTRRKLIDEKLGMGEGLHIYKIKGKYFITSAWYNDVMRLPVARADSLNGPWESNQNIHRGEQFGQVIGWKLTDFRPPLTTKPPFKISPPNPDSVGRMALHQGGFVDTPTGEWWGITMGEANAIGRTSALTPIIWQDGWPYFGLPGNLGRTPRTWVKPNTGAVDTPHAPYKRSDDFSGSALQPIWEWNHVSVDSAWSLKERPGFLRLHALPATWLWDARNTLTQRSIGPHSIPTAVMETAGMKPGDVAGFALFIHPEAWIGVEKTAAGAFLVQHDGITLQDVRTPLNATRVWLRANCEYNSQLAQLSYSVDGKQFLPVGKPFRMLFIGATFQGVRYALFNYHRGEGEGGYADFDSLTVTETNPSGLSRAIPYGRSIQLAAPAPSTFNVAEDGTLKGPSAAARFAVEDRKLGRVALRGGKGYLSVSKDGVVTVRNQAPGDAETFQWMETFTGELLLLSLETNRYLRVDEATAALRADSPGPEPNTKDARLEWKLAGAK